MFRLAHVTDPHFRSWTGAQLVDFVGKRAIGALNVVVNRGRHHKMELLEALRQDVRAQAPDHVAMTGDLSNVSLPAEFAAARLWLDACGAPPERVTVIPGNHDAYVPGVVTARLFERSFEPFMTAELREHDETYPFVRLRGDVALVAVNSCVATRSLGAWGEIGEAQRARLGTLLARPEVRERTRVVLLHHPPVMLKGLEERNLRDRAALADVLARAGADLVIHGHDHRDERATLRGPDAGVIPVIGAGSASYAGSPERRARYNVYEIEGRAITVCTRSHDEATGAFREVRREPLV